MNEVRAFKKTERWTKNEQETIGKQHKFHKPESVLSLDMYYFSTVSVIVFPSEKHSSSTGHRNLCISLLVPQLRNDKYIIRCSTPTG